MNVHITEFTAPLDSKKKRKEKWLFTKKDEPIFAIAGIWRNTADVGEAFNRGVVSEASGLMRFSFPHSHAFAGGRVLIEDADENEGPCAVEFGDGVSIIGEWRSTADGIYLEVPVYRTAKGTEVVARNWRLKQGEDGAWRSQREG